MWTGLKGIAIFFGHKERERWFPDWMGFTEPEMDVFWEEQTTLPRGGVSHHRTDLIVEWVRIDAQATAKLLVGGMLSLAIINALTVIGFLSCIW